MTFTLTSARWGIASAKGRSITIAITVACTICCVLFCSAIIAGFDETLRRMSFGRAAEAALVKANPITNERYGPPTLDDLSYVQQNMPAATGSAAWVQGQAAVQRDRGTGTFPVFGALGEYSIELDTGLATGRWLTAREIADGTRACLLGSGAADEIGTAAQVGATLRLSGGSCEVVGIMAYPDARPARRFLNAIVMPLSPVKLYYAPAQEQRRDLAWFTLFFPDVVTATNARPTIDTLLRKRHGIPQSRLSPYSYDDPDADVRDQQRQRLMMTRLLGSVTAIVLVVSLLSYIAVTVAACRSRHREFAIRMAMGAQRRDIARQVAFENVLLSIVGALVGIAAGAALSATATYLWGWPTNIDWRLTLATMLGGIAAGACIGSYGGWLAASTAPAAAAR